METKFIWNKPEDKLPESNKSKDINLIWVDKYGNVSLGFYLKLKHGDRWFCVFDKISNGFYDSTSDVIYWAYLNVPDIYKELK